MKNSLKWFICFLFLGCVITSCSDHQAPTAISDDSSTTLNKVTVVEYNFDYDLDTDLPYTNCVTGASMQNHGIVKVYVRELTTPSGNWTATGYVDYGAYGGVTLENLSTNEIWTLQNGQNPWNEIEIHNGSYQLHYHWNEVYTSGNENLHIHLKGFFTIDRGGNVTRALEEYFCN
jgi:hypothetical protein